MAASAGNNLYLEGLDVARRSATKLFLERNPGFDATVDASDVVGGHVLEIFGELLGFLTTQTARDMIQNEAVALRFHRIIGDLHFYRFKPEWVSSVERHVAETLYDARNIDESGQIQKYASAVQQRVLYHEQSLQSTRTQLNQVEKELDRAKRELQAIVARMDALPQEGKCVIGVPNTTCRRRQA
ncbi:hypothetical protein L6164_022697 [Bauhinia variegata]|uniref:Uncharacterized protein n=1 Tax=Bauhinia variegata TaxID=167791 RepID=A0ACB9MGC7_BAUVA|nr:hypothetical protein L6164_022697 [Bauhinia variegata]